ncbi:LLM class flavin-dependent oxidoreductase [Pseudonocardia acaciae]|uniref:LLM class flavin-dependent oxidoreductase n=1 Tax=Pseudonocardia acaciae TaxID=551276 RepID=UPI000685DE1D|nr:LLM class flavin-dependent oxidoreductase [Pseudonocardia acaciae]
MSPRLGVALAPEGPLDELVATAAAAERLGYDSVWVNDDRLQKDLFGVLAAMAGATSTVRLGPGVTNPYSRHPALLAAAIATLDELSGGRAVLGLGAGGTNHRALGIERRAPATALREAITVVRGLLAGDEVTLDGTVVSARHARLDFTPARASVPIYVGARGPKMLRTAGELADGVIIGNLASPAGWRRALAHVQAGCVGPAPALTAWVACAVDPDGAAARDAVRPMVATSLVTSRAVLPELGITAPSAFVRAMDRHGWSTERDAVRAAGADLPAETIAEFAIAGTPAECRERAAALLAEVPAIGELVLLPFPVPGRSPVELLRRFSEDVMEVTGVG